MVSQHILTGSQQMPQLKSRMAFEKVSGPSLSMRSRRMSTLQFKQKKVLLISDWKTGNKFIYRKEPTKQNIDINQNVKASKKT